MNKFQIVMGNPVFKTEDEYRSLLAEEQYDLNNAGELSLFGLKTAYEKAPPEELFRDAGRCGVGFTRQQKIYLLTVTSLRPCIAVSQVVPQEFVSR